MQRLFNIPHEDIIDFGHEYRRCIEIKVNPQLIFKVIEFKLSGKYSALVYKWDCFGFQAMPIGGNDMDSIRAKYGSQKVSTRTPNALPVYA